MYRIWKSSVLRYNFKCGKSKELLLTLMTYACYWNSQRKSRNLRRVHRTDGNRYRQTCQYRKDNEEEMNIKSHDKRIWRSRNDAFYIKERNMILQSTDSTFLLENYNFRINFCKASRCPSFIVSRLSGIIRVWLAISSLSLLSISFL